MGILKKYKISKKNRHTKLQGKGLDSTLLVYSNELNGLIDDIDAMFPSANTIEITNLNGSTVTVKDALNFALGTATGTKIGTSTTQKLGFFNATPVVRPTALTAANATATDGTIATNDTITNNIRTRVNEIDTKLKALGLIA